MSEIYGIYYWNDILTQFVHKPNNKKKMQDVMIQEYALIVSAPNNSIPAFNENPVISKAIEYNKCYTTNYTTFSKNKFSVLFNPCHGLHR
jgi:hypothetical protein